ncbi:MAG: class I SAM-dependent methyltransferase [Massilia sp.]
MNFKENETLDKLRGGYYTPAGIAQFLTRWVLSPQPKSLLEPSCGDGAFIRALAGLHSHTLALTAIERDGDEAVKAAAAARELKKVKADVVNEDFLAWAEARLEKGAHYDAVTGNPPYIRYQYLDEVDQVLSESIFRRYQLRFTKHTNAWVPFVIACIGLLAPGGRLGMVIPSEILHVLHAGSLRSFLLAQASKIFMIDPNELLFSEALQGTVLLMVEKKRAPSDPSDGVAIYSAPDNTFLQLDPDSLFDSAKFVAGDVLNGKWMKVLLTSEELSAFEKARSLPGVKRFSDVATVDVGIVTGANKFFLVSDDVVKAHGLEEFARPMFGRSEHCPGVIYDDSVHLANGEKGYPSNFLMFGKTAVKDLPRSVRRYITSGEADELHTRYKCRIRTPWYAVPSVYSTEIGMLKRAHNFPRLILNTAGAYTTDTAYRIRSLGTAPEKLVYCFINSLTALTAELEGRHYGGGVLELVPSEIEKLLIPLAPELQPRLAALDDAVRQPVQGELLLKKQDDHILHAVGLSAQECTLIRQALLRVRSRRHRLLDGVDAGAVE